MFEIFFFLFKVCCLILGAFVTLIFIWATGYLLYFIGESIVNFLSKIIFSCLRNWRKINYRIDNDYNDYCNTFDYKTKSQANTILQQIKNQKEYIMAPEHLEIIDQALKDLKPIVKKRIPFMLKQYNALNSDKAKYEYKIQINKIISDLQEFAENVESILFQENEEIGDATMQSLNNSLVTLKIKMVTAQEMEKY